MSAAMDQIANITPPKRIAAVNTGNDSVMENAKSGKLAAVDEKLENISDESWKNPDRERLATMLTYPSIATPIDALNTHAEAAIFTASILRSCLLMRNNIFSVKPSGGSGTLTLEKSFS